MFKGQECSSEDIHVCVGRGLFHHPLKIPLKNEHGSFIYFVFEGDPRRYHGG